MNNELVTKGKATKEAARVLANLDTATKNKALQVIAETIMEQEPIILGANDRDIETGRANGLNEALLDRLLLTPPRLESIANDVKSIVNLPDPVGETFDMRTLPNGLQVGRKRVPLGVIGAIYESRPNVTIDISVLCLKAGNAIILRGGKEANHSNRALAGVVHDACIRAGVPDGAVQFIENTDRTLVNHLLKMGNIIGFAASVVNIYIGSWEAGIVKIHLL